MTRKLQSKRGHWYLCQNGNELDKVHSPDKLELGTDVPVVATLEDLISLEPRKRMMRVICDLATPSEQASVDVSRPFHPKQEGDSAKPTNASAKRASQKMLQKIDERDLRMAHATYPAACENLQQSIARQSRLHEALGSLAKALAPAIQAMKRLKLEENHYLVPAAAACEIICDRLDVEIARRFVEDQPIENLEVLGLNAPSVLAFIKTCTSAILLFSGNVSNDQYCNSGLLQSLHETQTSNLLQSYLRDALLRCYVIHKRSGKSMDAGEQFAADTERSVGPALTLATEDRDVNTVLRLSLQHAIHDNEKSRQALKQALEQGMLKGNDQIASILLVEGVSLPEAPLVCCMDNLCALWDGDECSRDSMKMIFELSAETVDINATTGEEGFTALHLATYLGYPETVALLLEHGANAEMLDDTSRTPLQYLEMAVVDKVFERNSNNFRAIQTALMAKLPKHTQATRNKKHRPKTTLHESLSRWDKDHNDQDAAESVKRLLLFPDGDKRVRARNIIDTMLEEWDALLDPFDDAWAQHDIVDRQLCWLELSIQLAKEGFPSACNHSADLSTLEARLPDDFFWERDVRSSASQMAQAEL